MTDNDSKKAPPLWGMGAAPVTSQGPVFTEVRLRQFYRTLDGGQEVLPCAVFYMKDGNPPHDVQDMAAKIAEAVKTQVPQGTRGMTLEEVRDMLRNEVMSSSAAKSSGVAALTSLPEADSDLTLPPSSGGYDA